MKKLINQKIKVYGIVWTIRNYDENGSVCLYHEPDGEVWFNVLDTFKDLGGKKDNLH